MLQSNVTIFDIPIIIDIIGPFLTRHQLLQCIQVSKTWANHFLRFLYSSFFFVAKSHDGERLQETKNVITSIIQRTLLPSNLAYLSKIETEIFDDFFWDDLSFLPRLRSLGLFWFEPRSRASKHPLPKVVNFLSRYPGLRRLEMNIDLILSYQSTEDGNASKIFTNVLAAIKHHPGLEHFRLVCRMDQASMQIGQIFESIQNLKSLELWLWCVGSGSVFLSVCRQILEQQSALELRHLYLSMEDRVLENAVLARILPRCPKLESLMLFDPGMTKMYNEQAFTLEPLAPLFRNHCPGLKKLSINVAEEDTLQLVNSCTGLESLLLTMCVSVSSPLMGVLLPNHVRTLTSLTISRPFGPDPETLLDVMCSCSNLRTLNIHIVQESRPSDATETHGKSLKRRMQHAWMCVDLEDLTLEYSLGYGRTLSSDDSFRDRKMEVGGGSLLDRYFEYVFTQIGRLTRMKHLEIVVGYKLMVLKQGHLTKLAGLRNMQSVYLTHAQQAEAQWVMENWPMVVEVAGFPLEEDRGRIASLARWKPDFVIR